MKDLTIITKCFSQKLHVSLALTAHWLEWAVTPCNRKRAIKFNLPSSKKEK